MDRRLLEEIGALRRDPMTQAKDRAEEARERRGRAMDRQQQLWLRQTVIFVRELAAGLSGHHSINAGLIHQFAESLLFKMDDVTGLAEHPWSLDPEVSAEPRKEAEDDGG